MTFTLINPEEMGAPKGWTNGMLAPAGGRLLFVAGQDAALPEGEVETDDFVEQFRIALEKIMTVVRAAGGEVEDLGRLTMYVADMDEYLASRKALGPAYQSVLGRHFPAMALVQVAGLVDPRARIEIEATAVLAPQP